MRLEGKGTLITGAGHGIGIDPGVRPERIESPAADRLTWIQDLYSERYSFLAADAIAYRPIGSTAAHNLEGPITLALATLTHAVPPAPTPTGPVPGACAGWQDPAEPHRHPALPRVLSPPTPKITRGPPTPPSPPPAPDKLTTALPNTSRMGVYFPVPPRPSPPPL